MLGIDLTGLGTWTWEVDIRIIEVEGQDSWHDDNAIFKERDIAKEKGFGEKMMKTLEFDIYLILYMGLA